MTVPIHAAHRFGNRPFDCSGAKIRAQCRHLATVVTISGTIDDSNADRVGSYISRFIPTEQAFVLDLSGLDTFSPAGISFLDRVDDACQTAGMDWAVVCSPAVIKTLDADQDSSYPVTDSVAAALHQFADVIAARRRVLLPLLGKSA
ncbi:STAS domain-containing protein [Mycolicibacterium thermoresistibile]|jgi:anti-anti-sigma factor|uniref:Anti-sigma-factor antagonist n=2 Tax=Mycolicibacterium thermoresistibile TaxID=1797 RepID=G7CM60_MYCT3|nr:STAS domain-containing protein [Mycolicibacterium thermoresistibile]EHI11013.1 anti-sigma-factor antagonist [Mycolicibacterium thermoresistibile ATCC 19527]MCV7188229.1 STAS domain-containing protein [Mycolicibacterium thermoresistibile]GAT13305.1 anti-sigma-factor antagonist [Mycolicibacterium thermoresistibile]SNW18521.1 anti-sigma-factor antagonist [Mycolicibacterium thermoresistibile]